MVKKKSVEKESEERKEARKTKKSWMEYITKGGK